MAGLMIIKLCYTIAVLCEFGFGIVLLHKLYPEFCYKSRNAKVFGALMILLESVLVWYCMKQGSVQTQLIDFILNSTAMIGFVLILVFYVGSCIYQQLKSENLLQQESHRHLRNQYYGLKELYERNGRWMHDVKHELLYIESRLEENDVAGASESLQGYLSQIGQIERRVWSGFSFLDFILNYKKMEMDKEGIEFTLDVELQQIGISEEDLAMMLGNLLDNAIEAARRCEMGGRFIHLKIRNLNDMLMLNMKNSSTEIPRLENGAFVSRKQEAEIHGFGLKSVKRMVEAYEGEIHFQYAEDYFQVNLLI